jgi:hypothetical protein
MKQIKILKTDGVEETIHRVVSFEVQDEGDSYALDFMYDYGIMSHYSLPLSEDAKREILRHLQLLDFEKLVVTRLKIKSHGI